MGPPKALETCCMKFGNPNQLLVPPASAKPFNWKAESFVVSSLAVMVPKKPLLAASLTATITCPLGAIWIAPNCADTVNSCLKCGCCKESSEYSKSFDGLGVPVTVAKTLFPPGENSTP